MRTILLSALLLVAGCGCASLPFEAVNPATVKIKTGDGTCSATYIGPSTVLTAKHCIDADAGVLAIDGERAGYALLADDGKDHVMLRVTRKSLQWAARGDKPKVGDEVFKRGNPLGLDDVLLVGRVAGWLKDGSMLVDATGFKGDSGSALFDRKGRIVGVVSAMGGSGPFYLMIAFPMQFTEQDWQAARA